MFAPLQQTSVLSNCVQSLHLSEPIVHGNVHAANYGVLCTATMCRKSRKEQNFEQKLHNSVKKVNIRSNFREIFECSLTKLLGYKCKQSVDGMVCNRSVNEKKLAESGQASTNRGVQAWCKRQHPSAMVPGFDAAENG